MVGKPKRVLTEFEIGDAGIRRTALVVGKKIKTEDFDRKS
jgi:hypothetical protein